jgi:hypothetical protein
MKLKEIYSSLQMDRQVSGSVYEKCRCILMLDLDIDCPYHIHHYINSSVFEQVYPKIKDEVNETK